MDFSILQILILCLTVVFVLTLANQEQNDTTTTTTKSPTVFIAILVRNKAHALPYFLSSLSSLEYTKKRIALWYVRYEITSNLK